MSTSFDDTLLDPFYSSIASGGPDFSTNIERSGEGGAVGHRSVNREDYISRYEIDFANLDEERKHNLRAFGILRQGMARAFRFLAPDASKLIKSPVGILNPATGEIGYMSETAGETTFYIIEHLSDAFNAYNKRICKISPYEPFTVQVFDPIDLNTALATVTFPADPFYNVYTESVIAQKSQNLTGIDHSVKTCILNYREGKFTVNSALPAGLTLRVTGEYHLPVCFTEDWMKFSIDEVYTGAIKIGLEEVLPIEIGIV